MNFDIKRWDGEKISEPGIYVGIPLEVYHGDLCAGPSISSSGLRTLFNDSPRAYIRTSYLNPMRKPEKPSKPFIFGRAAHHLLLGESDFRKQFWVHPETYFDKGKEKPWNGNATVCEVLLSAARDAGLIVLSPKDIEMIRGMADMLALEPMVQAGVLSGLIEHSFIWQDEATGVWLKWRPDAIPTDSLDFADLKTAASLDDDDLARAIGEHGYHAQAGLGLMACRAVLGRDMESFTLVFVEKESDLPCVQIKTIQPGYVVMGAQQNMIALKMFAKCLETGDWPGPGGEQTDAQLIGMTEWQANKLAMKMKYLENSLA